jgi:hypothetical protein
MHAISLKYADIDEDRKDDILMVDFHKKKSLADQSLIPYIPMIAWRFDV